jgi:hypothetical protein
LDALQEQCLERFRKLRRTIQTVIHNTGPREDEVYKQMVMADETVPFAHERLNELCAQALSQDQEATIMKLGKEILSLKD